MILGNDSLLAIETVYLTHAHISNLNRLLVYSWPTPALLCGVCLPLTCWSECAWQLGSVQAKSRWWAGDEWVKYIKKFYPSHFGFTYSDNVYFKYKRFLYLCQYNKYFNAYHNCFNNMYPFYFHGTPYLTWKYTVYGYFLLEISIYPISLAIFDIKHPVLA